MGEPLQGNRPEPERLRRGRHFHKQVQADWQSAEGEVSVERTITKPSGRRGRIDVCAVTDDGLVAVVEIKSSDWDAMTEAAVKRNAKRYCRQVWQYIESQLSVGRDVSPGVVFPLRPRQPERLELVEALFEGEGIPVVWQDESTSERRARAWR